MTIRSNNLWWKTGLHLCSLRCHFWDTYTVHLLKQLDLSVGYCTSPTSIVSFLDPHLQLLHHLLEWHVTAWGCSWPSLADRSQYLFWCSKCQRLKSMLNATMLPDAMPVIRVLETWRTESCLNQFRICWYSLSLRGKRPLIMRQVRGSDAGVTAGVDVQLFEVTGLPDLHHPVISSSH